MGIIEHVANLLDQVDIKYTREENELLMRWQTDHFEDLKIRIVPNNDESWLYIVVPFASVGYRHRPNSLDSVIKNTKRSN